MRKAIVWVLALCVLAMISGCGGEEVEVVDLNKVLDALVATLDELKDKKAEGVPPPAEPAAETQPAEAPEGAEPAAAEGAEQPADTAAAATPEPIPQTESGLKPIESTEGQKENMKIFLTAYAKNLNAAKIMKKPLGVQLGGDGAIQGFEDPNTNLNRDNKENMLFKVEIDAERNRMIATDVRRNYRRDSRMPHMGMGFVAGYCMASMWGGQRRAGISGSRYRNMKMSPKSYHGKAVSSARGRSGSKSFKGGK